MRVGGHFVAEDFDARALAVLVAATVQRHYNEFGLAGAGGQPTHAVDSRFMGQFHGLPFLRPVPWCDEVKDRAAIDSVAGVPARADGYFGFAIAVDVRGGDANIVERREILGD